jgi:hypothetical protein
MTEGDPFDPVPGILSEVQARYMYEARIFQKHGDLGVVPPVKHVLDIMRATGRVSSDLSDSGVEPTSGLAYHHVEMLKAYREALVDLAAYAVAAIDEHDAGVRLAHGEGS